MTYDTINEILVHLFYEIWELEEKAIITEEFKDITNKDMHIIEAIGLLDESNMSNIAKKRNITVGSLTTSMNSLVRKGYVTREKNDADRRVVNIQLTDKGKRAFDHHADFHMQMTDAVVQALDKDEAIVLTKILSQLASFFKAYGEQHKD